MDWKKHYEERTVSAEEAVRNVKNGSRILLEDTICCPEILIDAMVAQKEQFRDIEFTHMYSLPPHEDYLDPENSEHFHLNSFMLGKNSRKAFEEGRVDFSVSHYGIQIYLAEELLLSFKHLKFNFRDIIARDSLDFAEFIIGIFNKSDAKNYISMSKHCFPVQFHIFFHHSHAGRMRHFRSELLAHAYCHHFHQPALIRI